ncbi:hypothetical protein [Streptomyces aureus]|uniref:hypothetical protein n=1 Tax=Streptomyces aureus TaxID=193461 RepID=UPI003408228A
MSPVSQAPPRTGHPLGRGSTGVRLPVPGTGRAPEGTVRGEPASNQTVRACLAPHTLRADLAPGTVRAAAASNQTVRACLAPQTVRADLAPQTVGADPAPKTDRAHQASKTTAADAAEETS